MQHLPKAVRVYATVHLQSDVGIGSTPIGVKVIPSVTLDDTSDIDFARAQTVVFAHATPFVDVVLEQPDREADDEMNADWQENDENVHLLASDALCFPSEQRVRLRLRATCATSAYNVVVRMREPSTPFFQTLTLAERHADTFSPVALTISLPAVVGSAVRMLEVDVRHANGHVKRSQRDFTLSFQQEFTLIFHALPPAPIELRSLEDLACVRAHNVQFWKTHAFANGFWGEVTEGLSYLQAAMSVHLRRPDANTSEFVVVELGASESSCCQVASLGIHGTYFQRANRAPAGSSYNAVQSMHRTP